MTIDKKLEGTKLEITLEGRLDTITAPTLEGELKQSLDGITELVFDFGKLYRIICIAVCCISFICNNLKSVLSSCFYKSIMNT